MDGVAKRILIREAALINSHNVTYNLRLLAAAGCLCSPVRSPALFAVAVYHLQTGRALQRRRARPRVYPVGCYGLHKLLLTPASDEEQG